MNAHVKDANDKDVLAAPVTFDAYEWFDEHGKKVTKKTKNYAKDREQDEDFDVSDTSARPTQITNKLPPSKFLALFGQRLHEYAAHRRIAVHQTQQEQLLKEKLLNFPEDESPIIVDMDFAENYEIQHQVEVQSEHWNHEQATLFMVITHYRDLVEAASEGKAAVYRIVSEAHVYVSSDRHHDTYFVQHAMKDLQEKFRVRGKEFDTWFINTDGAASHFKQRFTFFSVFAFKKLANAKHVMWETCAPGHGKGPWDGIGAVVKRLLRDLERTGAVDPATNDVPPVYCKGAFDVYNTLAKHSETWAKKVGSRVMLDAFFFHYVPVKKENVKDAVLPENVLAPISRAKLKPLVTALSGIRSLFCFDFGDGNKVRSRSLSCHCDDCLARDFGKCDAHKNMGKWSATSMVFEQPSNAKKNLRGLKDRLSNLRRQSAKETTVGEIVALETPEADDKEGFGFWLARVVEPAKFNYDKKTVKLDNVTLKPGGFYTKVKIIERFPVDSPTTYRLLADERVWRIDAEAVILRNVQLGEVLGVAQRRTRSGLQVQSQFTRSFELSEQELQRCTDAAEEKLDANGTNKHEAQARVESSLARNRIG